MDEVTASGKPRSGRDGPMAVSPMATGRGAHPAHAQLQAKVVAQLQALHAIKSAGLRMFASVLPAVRQQRDQHALPEVQDLLERMSSRFGEHEATTREHERRLRLRLTALGAGVSRPREVALGAAAALRGRLGRIRGPNHGANARDAYVFEHLEIAEWHLLEELARRADDEITVELARTARAEDEEMAATIQRNFPNVLSLMLASEGLPTLRTREPRQPGRGEDGPEGGER